MRSHKLKALEPRLLLAAGLITSILLAYSAPATLAAANKEALVLNARTRVETSQDSGIFKIADNTLKWNRSETAVIICDMWDQHWCKSATRRVAEMAPRVNRFVSAARNKGVLIVHAPSSTVSFYNEHPARKCAQITPKADNLPAGIGKWRKWMDTNEQAVYPIDQSDGGCDCRPKCAEGGPWRKQIATIDICDEDAVSDSGEEIWNLLEQRGIKNVMLLGVHTNMCVLGRPFGLRNMARFGKNVVLVRDLTDTMYNPRMSPYVSHFAGTDLIVEHIEKYVCPTITSTALTGQPALRFKNDRRQRLVFVIAENEYDADTTLPQFAHELQTKYNLSCEFALGISRTDDIDRRNNISGMDALQTADLAIIYVRRRTLPARQMKHLRDYIESGRPLIGLRTASHAFALRGGDLKPGLVDWPRFDPDVLGGNYHGHHGNKAENGPRTYVWAKPGMESHPILTGVPSGEFYVRSWLYKTLPLTNTTTTLMMGRVDNRKPHEPVAWTNTHSGGGRVFYTSLSHVEDFRLPAFRRMLVNAIFWALEKSVRQGITDHQRKADKLEFNLQRRDPETGKIIIEKKNIGPTKVGIVVVDMWNFHWCKTATERVAAMVPRMERCLTEARKMGMQVFLCPTDAVEHYVGTPQREAVLAIPIRPIPEPKKIECPRPPRGRGCACGPEKCLGNWGWDAMHPGLSIGENDLMPNSFESLYWICRDKGLEHLIFMGVHTQVCLLGKSVGLRNMKSAGFECILARDLTDAHPDYDPLGDLTPDSLTADTVAHFEKYLCPTINMYDELKRLGKCTDDMPLDPVRLTPWGTAMRPHLFEQSVTIVLSAPWQPNATIHYTIDGSKPTSNSPKYVNRLKINRTTCLRAQAFENGKAVCTETAGCFVRLGPQPPMPHVHIGDLEPLRAVGPGHSPSDHRHYFSPNVKPPQKDQTNQGKILRLRGKEYERGLGVHAPNQMIYEIKPEYERLVALAGVDEHILDNANGTDLAMYPSVVFRVFIDGKLAAESPVMRISFEPWRFDVKIPSGAKIISLVATDASDSNREDLANWVNAGFVLKK